MRSIRQVGLPVALAVSCAAACGSVPAATSSGSGPISSPSSTTEPGTEGTLLDEMIARAANCDGVSVEYADLSEMLERVLQWAQVTEAPPELVGPALGDAVEMQMPFGTDMNIVDMDGNSVPIRIEPSTQWTSDTSIAAEDPNLDVWMGISAPENEELSGATGQMALVFVTDGVDFAITGICEGPVREQIYSVFGDDAASDMISLTTMTGPEASDYYLSSLAATAPTTPPPLDLPQYAPGLTDSDYASEDSTVERRLRIQLTGDPIQPTTIICAAAETYVGECAELGALHRDVETGLLTIDLVVFTEPDAPVRVVQLVGTHYATATDVANESFLEGVAVVGLIESPDGMLTS